LKAGRFCASQFLDNQDHDNLIPIEPGLEIKHMHQKVKPCTLADIRAEFKVWEWWTVKEDGSPRHLEQTEDTDDCPHYWRCRNCQDEFWYWPEVQQHLADQAEAMLVPA
jgi:hypothetical protein